MSEETQGNGQMRPHIGWVIKMGTVYPYVAACVGIYYGRVKCQEYAEATQEDTIVLGADPNRKATFRLPLVVDRPLSAGNSMSIKRQAMLSYFDPYVSDSFYWDERETNLTSYHFPQTGHQ